MRKFAKATVKILAAAGATVLLVKACEECGKKTRINYSDAIPMNHWYE